MTEVPPVEADSLLERRYRVLGRNSPLFYDKPLHLVRGEGVWLYDADGKRYLDLHGNCSRQRQPRPDSIGFYNNRGRTVSARHYGLHTALRHRTCGLCPSAPGYRRYCALQVGDHLRRVACWTDSGTVDGPDLGGARGKWHFNLHGNRERQRQPDTDNIG